MEKQSIEQLQKVATQLRRDVLRMVHAVQSGHPGAPLGCAEFFVALYFDQLHHNPDFKMDGKGEDLFFLSNGHLSAGWYSVLARSGYFPVEELVTFRKLNSRLQGHPATHEHLPGIRVASGSLGQGLSVAIGVAEAKKIDKDEHLVYVMMGDGELQEGQVWEAAMYAAHHKMDNIIATIDYNGQQIDGPTNLVMNNRDLGAKYRAFGWNVTEMQGNDMSDIIKTLHESKTDTEVPTLILMHTEMGFGVDYMMGSHKWHGVAPNDEQLATALNQLPITAGMGDY